MGTPDSDTELTHSGQVIGWPNHLIYLLLRRVAQSYNAVRPACFRLRDTVDMMGLLSATLIGFCRWVLVTAEGVVREARLFNE